MIITHYLFCSDRTDFPGDYRNIMIGNFTEICEGINPEDLNLTKTASCIANELPCMLFENVCGRNKMWNIRQALLYFQFSFPGGDTSILWKTVQSAINLLLNGDNIQVFLTILEPYCPYDTKYCNSSHRHTRDVSSTESSIEIASVLKRTKRVYDPAVMMHLFNKFVCDQTIVESLVEYYDSRYHRLKYSRVWLLKHISQFWCCFARNLKELYYTLSGGN